MQSPSKTNMSEFDKSWTLECDSCFSSLLFAHIVHLFKGQCCVKRDCAVSKIKSLSINLTFLRIKAIRFHILNYVEQNLCLNLQFSSLNFAALNIRWIKLYSIILKTAVLYSVHTDEGSRNQRTISSHQQERQVVALCLLSCDRTNHLHHLGHHGAMTACFCKYVLPLRDSVYSKAFNST